MALVAAAEAPRSRKLRVGVFADAPLQPRWMVDALARVAASELASVSVLCVLPGAAEAAPWLLAAYRELDRRAFGAEPSELVPLAQCLPHARRVEELSAAALAGPELDVAFVLGRIDEAALEGVARYGTWRFAFGAAGGVPADLAGFHEVARGEPLTRSGLLVRLPGGAARLACESAARTFPHSVARNRAHVLAKSVEFPLRALRELHRCGPAFLERCRALAPAAAEAPPPGARGADLARIGARVARRAVSRALHIEQWFLAYAFGRAAPTPDLAGFTRLMPPKDRDWADPFVIEKGGRHYVFFEELPYARGKAHIAVMEIEPDGRCSAPVPVLERDYHLSYPFLCEDQGRLYMVPESAQNRTVELYRCVDFPRRWRLERVLLEGIRCVDATLHRAGERWWMFANVAPGESAGYDDELHLFHAERLSGEWKAHPANPVKSDPRGARPAGALYVEGGTLLRPAQVCVPRYGAGLAIHEVTRLTPHEYAEREVQRIVAAEAQGLIGLHTVNRAGDLTVVDAFTRRPRLGRSALPLGRSA